MRTCCVTLGKLPGFSGPPHAPLSDGADCGYSISECTESAQSVGCRADTTGIGASAPFSIAFHSCLLSVPAKRTHCTSNSRSKPLSLQPLGLRLFSSLSLYPLRLSFMKEPVQPPVMPGGCLSRFAVPLSVMKQTASVIISKRRQGKCP